MVVSKGMLPNPFKSGLGLGNIAIFPDSFFSTRENFDRWFCWNYSCLPLPHHVVLEFKNQAFDMLKKGAPSTEHNKKWGDKMVTACYSKVSFWFNMKVASICWFCWSTFPSLRCHATIPLSDDDVLDRPKLIFIALIGFSKALSWLATWKRSFCLGVEKLVQWENYICDMFTLRSL